MLVCCSEVFLCFNCFSIPIDLSKTKTHLFPATVPSFFPKGSSSSTPAHSPAAKSVWPRYLRIPVLLGPAELDTWTRSPSRIFLAPGEGVRVGVKHLWIGGGVVQALDSFEEVVLFACMSGYLQKQKYHLSFNTIITPRTLFSDSELILFRILIQHFDPKIN